MAAFSPIADPSANAYLDQCVPPLPGATPIATVGRMNKRKNVLAQMCLYHPNVDSQDLGLVVMDEFHAVAAAAGAPAGAPHWVGQFFALQQQQFQQIQQQVQQNNQQFHSCLGSQL
jgi:hypothetical protein